jgi:hypothetical protein
MSDASDIDVLFPGRDVMAKGEAVKVLPLFFGQYPQAIKLLKPVATVLSESGIIRLRPEGVTADFSIADDWALKLPEIMIEGGEALIQFLAFAINKPRKWFDALPADEGLMLVKAVFSENADFFVKRIRPLLGQLVKVNPQAPAQDGGPSQPDSSGTATPGTPSNVTP